MRASRFTLPLLLLAVGCGSVTPAGGGGGGSGATGRAGAGGGAGSGAGTAGTGAAGTGAAGTGAAGTGAAGTGAGGSSVAGTTGRGGTGGSGITGRGGAGGAGTGGAGGASQCQPGQVWCPGCTPGTGTCYSSGGCPGVACPPIDASVSDAAQATCADVTTLAECDARTDCHSVFVDMQNCRCAALGCCAHFSRCADGDLANCKGPVACTLATPHCEGPYVVSYASACYEGCARATECAP